MSIPSETQGNIRKAINHLAAICDFASSRDAAGFSASTAVIGHELANLPDRYWELGTYALAAQVASHHIKQVLAANVVDATIAATIAEVASGPAIEKDQIPSSWAMVDVSKDTIVLSLPAEDEGVHWRLMKRIPGAYQPAGRGRVWAVPGNFAFALDQNLTGFDCEDGVFDRIDLSFEQSDRDQRLLVSDRVIDVEDGLFVLKFGYDEDLVALVKTVPGRRWAEGRWTLPGNSDAATFIDRLVAEHQFLTTERSDLPMEKARNVTATAPRSMTIEINGELARISFPYNAHWVNAIKALPGRCRKYEAETKAWLITLDDVAVDTLLEEFQMSPSPVPDAVIEALRDARPYSAPAL